MITAKPFNTALQMLRTVFYGKPYAFTSVDLNRQLEAISYSFNVLSTFVGNMRTGFNVSLVGTPSYNSGTDTLTATISVQANSAFDYSGLGFVGPAVYHRGVRIEVPTAQLINYSASGTGSNSQYPQLRLFLIAKLVTLTPATDPTNCTVSDTSQHPGSVPSCDVVAYQSARLQFTAGLVPTGLASDEVVVCMIGSVCAQVRTHPTTGANTVSFVWRYSTFNLTDLVAKVGMTVNRLGTTQNGVVFGTNSSGGNVSMVDYQQLLIDYIDKTVSRLEYLLNTLSTNLSALSATVAATNTSLTNLQNSYNSYVASNNIAVANLQANAFIPIGGIIMFSGSTTGLFDISGRGLQNTTMSRFALCNGQNGTPNLQDRFVMGMSNANPMGATGGANSVKLTGKQSGVNEHTHFFKKNTTGGTSNVTPIPEGAEVAPSPGSGVYGRGNPFPLVEITNASVKDADEFHENRPAFIALGFIMRVQ